MANLYYWVANWNLSRAEAAQLLGGDVVDMVDCTSSAYDRVINTSAEIIGGYVTGSPDIRWTAAQFREAILRRKHVLRIDQSNLDLPLFADAKVVKDVEAGASTINEAVIVTEQRHAHGLDSIVYMSQSMLSAVENAMVQARLPHGRIMAYQYASPTSNPDTQLPGVPETLKSANADLSVIHPELLGILHSGSHPSPAHQHSLAQAHVQGSGIVQLDLRNLQWKALSPHVTVSPLPWGDQ